MASDAETLPSRGGLRAFLCRFYMHKCKFRDTAVFHVSCAYFAPLQSRTFPLKKMPSDTTLSRCVRRACRVRCCCCCCRIEHSFARSDHMYSRTILCCTCYKSTSPDQDLALSQSPIPDRRVPDAALHRRADPRKPPFPRRVPP